VLPLRYWTIYLYNHSRVCIGYTNTQKNVETLHKTNILEGIKLADVAFTNKLVEMENEKYPYDFLAFS
jgi:hypothetical protein